MAQRHDAEPDSMKIGHFPGLTQALHVLEHWLSVIYSVQPGAVMSEPGAIRCMTREQDNKTCIVSVAGTVNCETALTLGSELHECIYRGRHIMLSMSGVTDMDCAGVAVLVQAVAAARYRGLGFSLVAVTREVETALDLYHLKHLIPEYSHLADAKRQICRAS